MVQNLKKFLNSRIKKKSHSRCMKCQPKANNNRETVVVCARHVVKRPSKRMRASTEYTVWYSEVSSLEISSPEISSPEVSSLEISLSILSSLFHYFFEITNETSEKYDKLLIGETILVLVINQYYCA